MADSEHSNEPKPQGASAGGPPRPPTKTASALGDHGPDPIKQLTEAEREELNRWLARQVGQPQ